ncbi:MAG: hypothetical protein RL708_656 [Bacteroidota bacterium]|jgi:hypothetical protein
MINFVVMKIFFLFIILFLFNSAVDAQTNDITIGSISKSILQNNSTEEQKATAVFNWVTDNIAYDIDNMFNINFYENPQQTIARTIKTKKGVCQHYAYLFDTLCKSVGLQSYVISGFTKQKKYVDFMPHAWCATKVDGVWKLFDPTWAAGYIDNSANKFVRERNAAYFETLPQKMIQNHIPFDCIWQLLEHPISYHDFSNGKFTSNNTINFNDSIQQFFNQNELEQKQNLLRRIESSGVANQLVFDRINHLKNDIANIISMKYVNSFNSAVNEFNDAIKYDNEYINFYNVQFSPKKSDIEIQQMLDDVEKHNSTAKKLLQNIGSAPENFIGTSPKAIIDQVNDLDKKLEGQKEFVKKYIGTAKLFRKTLFYKYTIYGIPVN